MAEIFDDLGVFLMDGFAVIATHHKTGSVWMCRVFKQIATQLGISFFKIDRGMTKEAADPTLPAIIFNNHSNFKHIPWLLDHPRSKIFHLIRDPRDIIISGMHYHLTAREKWLHQPDPDLCGLTYQQKLNSLPDDLSRYQFEMRHSARRTINGMRRWNYAMPNSIECKYEELMKDLDMAVFTRIVVHLGFSPIEQSKCRKHFWNRSLFGQAKNLKAGHVRSGEPHQWRNTFDLRLATDFLNEFGDVLIELGYERDNTWFEHMTNSIAVVD